MRVAVVGATGAVGSTMLGVMRERSFPADEVVPFASERSAGAHDRLRRRSDARRVQRAVRGGDPGLRPRAVLGRLARQRGMGAALRRGGRGRGRQLVPLAHARRRAAGRAEVNPEALDGHHGIVANPNCSTMQIVVALKPILDEAGIERVVISTYQSVSGTGQRAVDELHGQAAAVIEAERAAGAGHLPAPDRVQRRCRRSRASRTATTTRPRSASDARDAQDPRARRTSASRPPARACPSTPATRSPSNVQTRDAAVGGGVPRAARLGPRRDRGRRPGRRRSTRSRSTPRAATTCSSGASAATRRTSAASTSGSSATTCARARPPTRSSSPSCCTCAGCCRRRPRRSRQRLIGPAAARRPRSGSCSAEPLELPPRPDAELAVDVARVRAHGLDPDREAVRDLGVGGARLEQLEHLRLARGQQLRAADPRPVEPARRGRARQHVHAARGEVDRVDDVAPLGLLRQAGGGAEREHLAALGRARPVGQHDDARLGVRPVHLEHMAGRAERAEVQQHHVGVVALDGARPPRRCRRRLRAA